VGSRCIQYSRQRLSPSRLQCFAFYQSPESRHFGCVVKFLESADPRTAERDDLPIRAGQGVPGVSVPGEAGYASATYAGVKLEAFNNRHALSDDDDGIEKSRHSGPALNRQRSAVCASGITEIDEVIDIVRKHTLDIALAPCAMRCVQNGFRYVLIQCHACEFNPKLRSLLLALTSTTPTKDHVSLPSQGERFQPFRCDLNHPFRVPPLT
jgi:hypothetical protein